MVRNFYLRIHRHGPLSCAKHKFSITLKHSVYIRPLTQHTVDIHDHTCAGLSRHRRRPCNRKGIAPDRIPFCQQSVHGWSSPLLVDICLPVLGTATCHINRTCRSRSVCWRYVLYESCPTMRSRQTRLPCLQRKFLFLSRIEKLINLPQLWLSCMLITPFV